MSAAEKNPEARPPRPTQGLSTVGPDQVVGRLGLTGESQILDQMDIVHTVTNTGTLRYLVGLTVLQSNLRKVVLTKVLSDSGEELSEGVSYCSLWVILEKK